MLKRTLGILCLLALLGFSDNSFRKEQKKFSRVKTAYEEKWSSVKLKLEKAGVDTSNFEIFIRIFKIDAIAEVWARSGAKGSFKLVEKYPICSSSGEPGPKRRQGDGQVPEGFYEVKVFNPTSSYHLSLGINYPNRADKIIGGKTDLGGDIMIHGNCVTIGCIPLTDDKIKEVYILAVEARNAGQQRIQIHIFPTALNDKNLEALTNKMRDKSKSAFWTSIAPGYNFFESKKVLPKISVDTKGNYVFE